MGALFNGFDVAPDALADLVFLGGNALAVWQEGLVFADAAATLRTFDTNPDLAKSILVLAPHPDDAEIAAFGLYAQRKATVVTVTAGNAGAATYEAVFDDLAEHYLFKGRMRVIDSITVPWHGGIPPERAFNMGYFDARLAEMYVRRDAVIPEMYRANGPLRNVSEFYSTFDVKQGDQMFLSREARAKIW